MRTTGANNTTMKYNCSIIVMESEVHNCDYSSLRKLALDINIPYHTITDVFEGRRDAITSNTEGIYELIAMLNIKQYFNETQLNRYGNKQQDIGVVALPEDFWDGVPSIIPIGFRDCADFFIYCAENRIPALYFG